MTNKNAVQNESPGRRAAAYWFEDGLPELLAGLMFLACFLVLLAGFLRWINYVLFVVLWSVGFTFLFTLPAWGVKVLDFFKTRLPKEIDIATDTREILARARIFSAIFWEKGNR